ncbi:F-box/kelch-repeat protein [Hibiscus syriacus]|uniref:F-box/kelch-repeat protein n=1 Tax=Hibiscus syriacus TaxID=106335 RepID=A0A6A3BJN0_HIBSY|nr:F-box/kelch-repeat protein At5g43190-like [Hibiscus syriacus]KAE8715638.1 F-box/kelch-repeat protein [Hibiscus syriacus]
MKTEKSKSAEMDPGIWSKLPPELLEHILSFLPLKTLLTLRSTCKRFKSLVFSPPFISKHSSASHFTSFLLLSHPQCYGHFPLYDTIRGAWRNLALPFSFLPPCAAQFNLLSSCNGLVCFSLPNSCCFLVCNLLAKSSRVIQFPFSPFAFEMLTLVSAPDGYNIFMLCSKFSSNHAFVYDSKDHSWTQYDGFQPVLIDNFHQEGASFNGFLCFATPEPYSVVSFDLEKGNWETLNTEMPGELTFVRLVSDPDGGKLYLVGGIGRNGISRSMRLWELGNGGMWVEVERLPELMCRKFVSVCYHNYEHVYCFWHQGIICVCCHTWPEVLYCKLSRRTWHWIPKCPSLPDKWSCGFRWFSFLPDLYALT